MVRVRAGKEEAGADALHSWWVEGGKSDSDDKEMREKGKGVSGVVDGWVIKHSMTKKTT